MTLTLRERRTCARREPEADESLASVRLRTGRELSVVNLSDAGLLTEGATRLLPGTHVEVHVVTREGRTLVRGRLTRAYVWALSGAGVRYRAAIAFERLVDTSSSRVATTHLRFANDAAGQGLPGAPHDTGSPVEASAAGSPDHAGRRH